MALIRNPRGTAAARACPGPASVVYADILPEFQTKPRPLRLVRRTRGLLARSRLLQIRNQISLATWSVRRAHNALSAELLDQHLATLSSAATPQVLSTDRHTVKPWFAGKLPFSFNLPEATALPPGTTLRGADLTWIGDRPAAVLLFTAGKHQVSVFIAERNSLPAPAASTRSGFALRSTTAGELRLTAISDTDPQQLERLLASLAAAQPSR